MRASKRFRARPRNWTTSSRSSSASGVRWSRTPASSRTKTGTASRGNRHAAAASSVLKFDIAVLFNRHLLERLHRTFQQSDVVGSARLAIQTAARGLGASDALLLLADLAARQIFKGRGRNVGRRGGVEVACARAGERGESNGNICVKARHVVS